MKKIRTIFPCLTLLLLLTGCFGPKTLQKQVNKKTYQPVILHNTEALKEKSDILMSFKFRDSSYMPEQTLVTKKSGYFVPLLLVYAWNYDMVIKLGNSSSNPKAKEFVQKTLEDIFERSGNFTIVPDTVNSHKKYQGIISVKKININCNYKRSGFFLGAAGTESERAENSLGHVIMTLQLFNENGELVYEKDYEEQRTVNFIGSSNAQYKIKHDAMQNLLENLTLSTKAIGSQMVEDLNAKLIENRGLSGKIYEEARE